MNIPWVLLIDDFEDEFPGWNWLVRSDSSGRYFVNLTPPEWEGVIVTKAVVEAHPCYKAWADSPEAAFDAALSDLRTARTKAEEGDEP